MRNIPMDLLRFFVTVVEMGGFTVAGQLLGRSQPAVSLQIKRLEELIDSQLFFRGGPQLELTLSGDRLLNYAHQILTLNDEALAELDQLEAEIGPSSVISQKRLSVLHRAGRTEAAARRLRRRGRDRPDKRRGGRLSRPDRRRPVGPGPPG